MKEVYKDLQTAFLSGANLASELIAAENQEDIERNEISLEYVMNSISIAMNKIRDARYQRNKQQTI